ncbi:MAG: 3-dehydroquinate synthase [Candidatus Omnitrophica bacterium]|nr:3-dehydroquinate synthase [Candidatus Omnitrophota bacterium]
MRTVRVRLGARSYPVLIGKDVLASAARHALASGVDRKRCVIVTQKEIAALHGPTLEASLAQAGIEHTSFLTPSGAVSETSKTQTVLLKLIRALADYEKGSGSAFVIALGGGVIGDLAGFAASIYRRGVPFVQIPTTLTAQVDSAIGGKNGIDLPEGKNLLGTIYQPRVVLADTKVLQSLPDRHWSDGSAEVIKYGVIKDIELFASLEHFGLEGLKSDPVKLEKVIARCAQVKADVVSRDEMDKSGERMILNFGHTAGHAIEAAAEYGRYTHGEAVGIGMLVACDIAQAVGVLKDAGLPRRLEALLVKFRLPLYYKGLDVSTILRAMGYDKKFVSGRNRFILPVRLGRTVIVRDIPQDIIVRALQHRKR